MKHKSLESRLNRISLSLALLLTIASAEVALAQTTAFTYQGKLSDTGGPASGQYDLQFKLFDTQAAGTGTQQGGTVTASNVTVANGIFTVQIDFGASALPGASRFLEIAVKPTSGSEFTTLSPRQPVTSSPYAIRSLNATTADGLSVACMNCVTSGQIQSLQGSQISGLIPITSVPPGSGNYIQNTTTQQPSSNFNISGDGTAAGSLLAGTVRALTQYDLGGSRILSSGGTRNLIAGATAGGGDPGGFNAVFGYAAGTNNTTGFENSFFGESAGSNNRTGSNNTFIGFRADIGLGQAGDSNTLLGALTSVNAGLSNSTAIGANAQVTTNHTIVLGTDQEVVDVPGKLQIDTLGTAGSQQLCLNSSSRVAPCSSSLRYKSEVQPFNAGLEIINRLRPITFTWKDGGMRDLGLAAEEVERVEPLLTFRNRKGQIEGVKYIQLNVVLINAIKQQQEQIGAHQKQIEKLESIKAENASLKAQIADLLLRLERVERKQAERK